MHAQKNTTEHTSTVNKPRAHVELAVSPPSTESPPVRSKQVRRGPTQRELILELARGLDKEDRAKLAFLAMKNETRSVWCRNGVILLGAVTMVATALWRLHEAGLI